MSWRSGSTLFHELWPLLQTHLPDRKRRQEFLRPLLKQFLDWDTDPENLADLDPEVRQALTALGALAPAKPAPAAPADDVTCCLRQLTSPVEKERATAAKALEFFIRQADDPPSAAATGLAALAAALRDASATVRRAAANSIEQLLADDFPLPKTARPALEAALADSDELVRKRIAKILKRAARTT
jgi:hypothetical protein